MTPAVLAAAYGKLLREFRAVFLAANAAHVGRLETVFTRAVQRMTRAIEQASGQTLRAMVLEQLLHDVESALTDLGTDFAGALNVGQLGLAQVAADREAATAMLVGAPADARLLSDLATKVELSDGTTLAVDFGHLAQAAVQAAANRVYSDGLKLSDRLYNLDTEMRATVHDTIVQGVTEQWSAADLARKLRSTLSAAGSDNPRYHAMRIARTEINVAHRTAHVQSCLDPGTGQLKDYILAVGWRLSISHKEYDVCDIYASDDGDGLGEGNYLPGNVPGSHAQCLCYTLTVLKEAPEVSVASKVPVPDEVPESQARYYAERGDRPAQRWLDRYAEEGD